MTRRVDKVVIYITRGDQLLVFTHPDFPEAGIQVPAGTVEPGEEPVDAARREATEETGLDGLTDWRFLGEREHDMADVGRDEIQRRFFFHARCDAPNAPERWRWVERFGPTPGVVFAFFWAPFRPVPPGLIAGQGALLDEVLRAVE